MSSVVKTVYVPDTLDLQEKIDLVVVTGSLEIATSAQYHQAADRLREIKMIQSEVSAQFDPIIKSANDVVKLVRDMRDRMLDPLQRARVLIEASRTRYERDQELERARQEQALREKMEEQHRLDADALESMGLDAPAAPAIQDLSPMLPPMEKSDGVGKSGRWKAKVTDLRKLVEAVAAGKAPLECLQPNETVLNSMAQASRKSLSIPGVEAYRKEFTTVRSK